MFLFLVDISSIEEVVGTNGTWDNIGLLAGVQSSLVGYAAALAKKYPGVKIAGSMYLVISCLFFVHTLIYMSLRFYYSPDS